MEIHDDGQIFFEGVSAEELASAYGTPLYVYEENRIRQNFRRALAAFRKYYPDTRFFYAIKANNNLAVANILRQEACPNSRRLPRVSLRPL